MEVHTCTELREALANAAVEHVLLMPRPGGDIWNCSAADFPPHSVEISGRNVLMEGYGEEQLYYDVSWGGGSAWAGGALPSVLLHVVLMQPRAAAAVCDTHDATPAAAPQANKVNNQIIVHEGASLTVANLWADNCVQAQSVPFTCLATTKGAAGTRYFCRIMHPACGRCGR